MDELDDDYNPEDDGLDFFRGLVVTVLIMAPFWIGCALLYLYLTR